MKRVLASSHKPIAEAQLKSGGEQTAGDNPDDEPKADEGIGEIFYCWLKENFRFKFCLCFGDITLILIKGRQIRKSGVQFNISNHTLFFFFSSLMHALCIQCLNSSPF